MLEEPENCVVAYGIASLVSRVEFLQYALAPVKLVMPQEGELDTQPFEEWLRAVGATHVVCMLSLIHIWKTADPQNEPDLSLCLLRWE